MTHGANQQSVAAGSSCGRSYPVKIWRQEECDKACFQKAAVRQTSVDLPKLRDAEPCILETHEAAIVLRGLFYARPLNHAVTKCLQPGAATRLAAVDNSSTQPRKFTN